jgi:hypothetical protein
MWGENEKRFRLRIAWAIRKEGDRVGVGQITKPALEGDDPYRGHRQV